MPFLSISIDVVGGLDAETIESACFESGALSVTLSDRRDDPVLEPAPGEVRLWPSTRVQALFPGDRASATLVAGLGAALGLPPSGLRLDVVADRAWEREWLRDFHAMRFGERLWIAPSHEPVTLPDAVVVSLDPGLAFGTGSHATTAMCLRWLDAHAPSGLSVIDYGCGSGILAIAAVKLGAARAHAWDIDPQALLATRDNAARNVVADRVSIATTEDELPVVDVLLSNILAGPLIELRGRLAKLVRPGGQVVLAGMLANDAPEVARAYGPWFDIGSFDSREGWTSLAGVRRVHDLP